MGEVRAPDSCLFCGVELDDDNRTDEHVFPRWLQRRYGLANLELVLLNGSAVRYSRLLVPACRQCNNTHASQLEQRVKDGTATPQDIWIWLLKIELGILYYETGTPWSRDRRTAEALIPVVDRTDFDLAFLHALFGALSRPDPQYAPDPLGSVFDFPTDPDRFEYWGKLYRHPASQHEQNYMASCMCALGHCWIALFDDAGNIATLNVDLDAMNAQVEAGRDPVTYFPELIYLRARFDYMPRTLVIGPPGEPAKGVAFLPSMGNVPRLADDRAVLDAYRASLAPAP